MKESQLEQSVGDIVYRTRLISDLIQDIEVGDEVAYGPLTLQRVEDGVLPVDFDGRVYETITIPDAPADDQITEVRIEADTRIEQLHDEL